jgi:hypothetical protein
MKVQRQKLQLKLSENTLLVYRLNNDGTRSLICRWEIWRSGAIPRALFDLLRSSIQYQLKSWEGERFSEFRTVICSALNHAAESCGCQSFFYRAGGVLTFYLKEQPLIAFDIPKTLKRYRPSQEFLHSDAVFRWTIKRRGEKSFEFVPQPSNPKWRA